MLYFIQLNGYNHVHIHRIGSETTGVSIFDHMPTGAKTGIRDRALRPVLGIIDPDHTKTLEPELVAFPGLDVLAHALESFTAVPFQVTIHLQYCTVMKCNA